MTEEFWRQYDMFCVPEHLKELITKGKSALQEAMCTTMRDAHESGEICNINRPENGWRGRMAWLALRDEPVRNENGNPVFYVRVGDVVIIEGSWNDKIITHSPPRIIPCGYLLTDRWDEMVGLFMPLFDRATIERCIELRMAQNVEDAITLTKEASRDWRWY